MTNGKVLVVDDDAHVRSVLEWLLRKDGIEIVTASDGEQALDMYQCAVRAGMVAAQGWHRDRNRV